MAPQRTPGQQQQGPATRTRAVARQQQHQHAADMVLPLLLQHDSVRKQLPLVGKLLCCSKCLAAAVAVHSAGQLDMPRLFWSDEAEQAVIWLRKHARLLRSLDTLHGTGAFVAAVMAAGPQSLLLQSLAIDASNTSLPLLAQLPASRLTHLSFFTREHSLQPEDRAAFVARLSAALGRLTALRSLELHRSTLASAPGLCGLSALTQLTALRFHSPLSDLLQHAPPQLLELELTIWPQQQPLDLHHLSAATALSIRSLLVREGDVLPPNLLRLQASYCRSAQPLLPLVQLQQLQVKFLGMDITADQLRQLSSLTALDLRYDDSTEPPASTGHGAWPLLPLRRLALEHSILSAPVCQHLAQLSGLTSLVLQSCTLPQAGSAQQLAAALRQLSGLQQLELSVPLWPYRTSEDDEGAVGRQLLQAMGSLQQLRELRLRAFPFVAANSSSLAALTALTSLSLSGCILTNAAVMAVASHLPGLHSLDCSCSSGITDSALPAIGRLLQLTRLSLSNTGVSAAGLCQLTRLTRLRELHVPHRVAAQQKSWILQQLPELRLVTT